MSLSISFQKTAESADENQISLSDYNPSGGTELQIARRPITTIPRILVLIDSSRTTTTVSGIRTRMNALGYVENSTYFISSASLTNTYTGVGDLDTPYQYNVVFIATNSGSQGANSLGTRLNAFAAAGNHIIMTTFSWNIPISQATSGFFNYSLYSPLVYSASQSNIASDQTLTVETVHPITSGLDLNIGQPQYNNSVTLASGATLLSRFPANSQMALAVETVGSANLVAINIFLNDLTSITATQVNRRNLLVNCILWCTGNL